MANVNEDGLTPEEELYEDDLISDPEETDPNAELPAADVPVDEPEDEVPDECTHDHLTLCGRRKIYTSVDDVTDANVLEIVNRALNVHMENLREEEYLYWYRRGVQPILARKKKIRPEICNRIVVNNADMVVKFRNGYFLTKPVSYVAKTDDETLAKNVSKLNDICYAACKSYADNEVIDWFHTVGVGAIFVQANESKRKPVLAYAMDPRAAFCVYSMRPGNKRILGINMVSDGTMIFVDAYTDRSVWRLKGGYSASTVANEVTGKMVAQVSEVIKKETNTIGIVPIIEYQSNGNRMSAFEPAIPLMDEINKIESNRADGVEQQIQQLLIAINCQFEEGTTANKIQQAGMVCLQSDSENRAEIKVIGCDLNQTETQTTIDNLYEQMLEKCGVPSSVRDGGSTSDNVGAVYLRSGWAAADTDAHNTEDFFRKSNTEFTEIVLKILAMKGIIKGLDIEDIDICFIRNDQNNILAKAQAAVLLKQIGFAPELVFERSGLSSDPIADVERSRKYIDMVYRDPVEVKQNMTSNTQTGPNPDGEDE